MSTRTASRDAFMPRPPGGLGRGLLLALLVHGLLVAALAVGVSWRSSNPQGIQAELWAAVPQVAAPRAAAPEERPEPPPPPPPPRPAPEPTPPPPRPAPVERSSPPPPALPDPQIAIAQEKAKKEAARKLELAELAAKAKAEKAEKAQKAEKARLAEAELADKKRKELAQRERERELAEERAREKALQAKAEQAAKADKAETQRLAEAREAAIRRMTAQAGGSIGQPGSTGSAAQNAAPSAGYTGRVIARIKPNIVFVDNLAGNPEAEVLVRLAPDGRIISQKLVRSSGSREWDQAVQRAIERTEVLPRDADGRVPASMSITFKPRE